MTHSFIAPTMPGIEVREHEPLAPYTTYKIGGPARWLVEVKTRAALPALLGELRASETPWFILGNGSNVLVSDRGFGGCVVLLGGEHAQVMLTRDVRGPLGDRPPGEGMHLVRAGAAVSITRILRLAKEEALSGLWCLAGIPGTLGGAVRMNAGTRYGELAGLLEAAELCSGDGYRWVEKDSLGLSYRASALPPATVVSAVDLVVGTADEAMRRKLDEVLAYRKDTQPLHLPSCGSVFANPQGDAAGRLIEAAGLKGTRIGDAEVSTQHANWIVNRGAARAADVLALIMRCREAVRASAGVALRPEVKLVGDWLAEELAQLGPDLPGRAP